MRLVVGSLLAVIAVPLLVAMAALSVLTGGTVAAPANGAPAGGAGAPGTLAAIPTAMLVLYERAATTCTGLPWEVLAGIGTVESANGTSNLPGVHSGANSAGAEGPMQFLPATFAAYDLPVPPRGANPPSPYDATDAVYAAARMLCANGARHGADVPAAVYAYNHSQAYVAEVLSDAASYAAAATVVVAPTPAAAEAVSYALAQIGTPYVWGGETPGVGFDCSGLVQAAYAAAGIAIPRTSGAQWLALPHVPLDDLRPGDLVFFAPGEFFPGLPGHVGIYIGKDQMIDAPHTGATVRVENVADWPRPFGAARPAAHLNRRTP
jgi:cell wall-associated NlpC family hydrolase